MELITSVEMKQLKQRKVPQRLICRGCGSKNLLTYGLDQFCCDCDWDNLKEYVELGLMNDLDRAYREQFGSSEKSRDLVGRNKKPGIDNVASEKSA